MANLVRESLRMLGMTMRQLPFTIIFLALVGCQSLPKTQPGESSAYAADRAGERDFVRSELYFAIGLIGEDGSIASGSLGEDAWSAFLGEVVVPLFPDGLTVFDATGSWLSDRFEQAPRLATKVLVILHPQSEEAESRIEKIRSLFLELSGQDSVLRVSQAASVSF